jgi:multiple RNA-binding domain-containing protein 1
VEFSEGDSAVKAYTQIDSQIFQGRLLHIIPAAAKKESKLDEFAISQLPLKVQKKIRQRAKASSSRFNWNSLYMNADAVLSSISSRLGIAKSEALDPTSSDAAVKQAFAETHIIQETKNYFGQRGVDLEAFKSKRRGETAILVKNFPFGTNAEDLRKMFEDFGKVVRFLMPPAGTVAIAEFTLASEARAAFKALAYQRFKSSILFLEWAPKDLFTESAPTGEQEMQGAVAGKPTAVDLLEKDTAPEVVETSTLFVKNLNFSTTTRRLMEAFSPLEGFVSANIKTKPDPKNPRQTLSMGFGFVEFRSKANAQTALVAMNGHALEGYKLDVRASQRALDAAEEQRKENRAKALAGRRSKIIIKNLPFEASKKEVRALFAAYGQLRTLRVPKKFDSSSRGFAFAEYFTPREAANAMDALRNTHLLGRRLVLEYAEEEPEDAEAEIERMEKKVGSQTSKLALQKLAGPGRKKFQIGVSDASQDPS